MVVELEKLLLAFVCCSIAAVARKHIPKLSLDQYLLRSKNNKYANDGIRNPVIRRYLHKSQR